MTFPYQAIEICYADTDLIPSFYEALKSVAHERIYLEMIEPPPLEKVIEYQTGLIAKGGASYYAVLDKKVVGFCDVFPESDPKHQHRGSLGMGLLPEFRGKGLGSKLVDAVIKKSKMFGLEKIELNVYTSNKSAIALYKKFGFAEEGLIKKYRKLDDQYFDCLLMGRFLKDEN